MKTEQANYTVAGVGSPVVDQVVQVSHEFLHSLEGEKGGMELIEEEELAELLASLPEPPVSAAGGSAGNTTFALARMGCASRFFGVIGDDVAGKYYQDAFIKAGGDGSTFQVRPNMPTAQCVSLVTPDGERTMRTHLGAALTLAIGDIVLADFKGCDHVHVEGYLLFNEALMRHVLETAKKAGCSTSVDLASFEVVNATKGHLRELLDTYVDVVFANEEEAEAFAGTADRQKCMAGLAGCCQTAAIKYGADGAEVQWGTECCTIPAVAVENVVDTTGAGDMWAAGFLYGRGSGKSPAQCGYYGSLLGATVVQHQGASIPEAEWQLLLEQIYR